MSKPADKPLISDTAKEDHTHPLISCVKVEETSCLEDIFRAKTPIIIGDFSYEWATRSEFPRNTTETRLTRTLKNLCRIKYFWKRCRRCVKLQMKSYERGLTSNRRCKKHKFPKAINRKRSIKSEPKIEMYEGSENKSIVNNNKDLEQSYHIESSVQLLDNDAPYLPKLLTIEVDSDISEIENRTSNINKIIEHKKVKVEQDCINSDTIKEFLQNIAELSKEAGSAEDREVARLKVRSQEYLFGTSDGLPLINNDCGYDDIVNFLFPNSEKDDDRERSITKKSSTKSEYEKTHFDFFLELLSGHTVISDTQNISIDENSKNSKDLSEKMTGDQSGISVPTDDVTSPPCGDDSVTLIAGQNKEFSKDKQVTETELKRKEAEVPQQTVQRKSIKHTASKSVRINQSSNEKTTLEDSENVTQEANACNTNMLNTSVSNIKTEPVEPTVAAVHIPTTHTASSTVDQTHSHPSTIASGNTVSTNKKPDGLTYSKSAYSNSKVLANNLSINSPFERSHQRQGIPENATMPRMVPQTFSNYPKQPLLGCSPVNHQQSNTHVGNLAQKQSLNRSFGVPSPRQSPQVAQVANMNLPSPQLPPEQNNTMRQMLENLHNSSVPTTLSSNHQVNPKDQSASYCPSEWTPLETGPLMSIESSAYSTQNNPTPAGQATPHRGVPHQSSKTPNNLRELLKKPMNNFSSNAPIKDADHMRLPVKRNASVVHQMINDHSLRKTAKTHNNLIDSQSVFTGRTSTHKILGQNAKKIPTVIQQSNQMNISMNPNAPMNPTGQQQIFRKTLNNSTAPSHASPNHSTNQILKQNKTTAPQRIINNSADHALRQGAKICIKNPAVPHIVSGTRMNQPTYHQILGHNTKKTPTVDQVNLMHYLNQGHTQNASKNPTGPQQILNQQLYNSTDNTLAQIARHTDTLVTPYFLSMNHLNSSNNLILTHNNKNSTGPQFHNNLTGAQFQRNISVSQYQNTTGPQFPNNTTLPHNHNITGPQFHINQTGQQFHDTTGSHINNVSTGPQLHKNTTLTQFHNTALPQFHNTALPQFHNTTGPQLYNNSSGSHLQNNSTGPQLHNNNSVGSQFHKNLMGTQLHNNSSVAQSHNTIGPQFHKNNSSSQYHNTTGTQVHKNPTGPHLHKNSTVPQPHNTIGSQYNNNNAGPQFHNTTTPQLHNTNGPQLHNTNGPQLYNITGLQLHNTNGPQLYNTNGPQLYNITGLQLHNTNGPQLHNTNGPQLYNTTGLQLHNTIGSQFHKNSHDPQQIFVYDDKMYNFTGG